MVPRGKHPIAIALFEDGWPLARASQTGALTIDADNGAVMSVWDLFEPMGSKKGNPPWMLVVVNSLRQPLTVDQLLLDPGELEGFAAATDFTTAVPGTENQIPGVRDHPAKPGVTLTAAAAWTFSTSGLGHTVNLHMKLSHQDADGKNAKVIGVAMKYGLAWIHPACAVCTDLEKYRKAPGDTDADLLSAFADKLVGNQDDHFEIGDETTIWGRVGGVNENCMVVWMRPAGV